MSDNYDWEQELEEWAEYFDSDVFLEEPWVQELAREFEREKVLFPNPKRLREVEAAWSLAKTIVAAERLEGELGLSHCEAQPGTAIITLTMRRYEWLTCGMAAMPMLRQLMRLCDGFTIYPYKTEQMVVLLEFKGALIEVK